MTKPDIDAEEVARMVAEKTALGEADLRRKQEKLAAELAKPVAPSARSRWQFGIESEEDGDGTTLVLRCYPRKYSHSDESSPFRLEPRGWIVCWLGVAIVMVSSVLVPDWRLWLGLWSGLLIGLLFAHYARIVRIRITRQGHFIIYESDPRRPIGIGAVGKLKMDVHRGDDPRYHSMRCGWVTAEGPKWVSRASFELCGLPRADLLTVERFIKKYTLPGL